MGVAVHERAELGAENIPEERHSGLSTTEEDGDLGHVFGFDALGVESPGGSYGSRVHG
jgi:hypothetical protein